MGVRCVSAECRGTAVDMHSASPWAVLRVRMTRMFLGYVGSVLEVILENLGGEGRVHLRSLRSYGAYDFSAADDLGGGEPGNFGGQHETDFYLHVGLQPLLRTK